LCSAKAWGTDRWSSSYRVSTPWRRHRTNNCRNWEWGSENRRSWRTARNSAVITVSVLLRLVPAIGATVADRCSVWHITGWENGVFKDMGPAIHLTATASRCITPRVGENCANVLNSCGDGIQLAVISRDNLVAVQGVVIKPEIRVAD
jgi:hypothetical protein